VTGCQKGHGTVMFGWLSRAGRLRHTQFTPERVLKALG